MYQKDLLSPAFLWHNNLCTVACQAGTIYLGSYFMKFLKEQASFIIELVLIVAVIFLINKFLIINATIPSGSMEMTIMPGDRVVGLQTAYLFHEPERGDIVIFKYPVDDALGTTTYYIKRIIGLPGETVNIRDGKVYINDSDTPIDESYINGEWTVRNSGTYTVPDGCYFMMGDNRNYSSDSRYWKEEAYSAFAAAGKSITEEEAESLQYVRKDQIVGKAGLRYWPLNRISIVK